MDATKMNDTMDTNDDDGVQLLDPSLLLLLQVLNKEEQLTGKLKSTVYTSIASIQHASIEDLGQVLPKMLARLLKKAVDATGEILELLQEMNKAETLFPILYKADIKSLEGLETVEKVEGISNMQLRLCKKKAAVAISHRPLKSFLVENKQEKLLPKLVAASLISPQDIRDIPHDKLSEIIGSKILARKLQVRASMACAAATASSSDPKESSIRYHQVDQLSQDDIHNVQTVWRMLSALSASKMQSSFGHAFYDRLTKLDHLAANGAFMGVSLEPLGLVMDNMLGEMIEMLGDLPKTESTWTKRRDALIARFVKYGILPTTLWLGAEAFQIAAVVMVPTLQFLKPTLKSWNKFYYTLMPPLHPTLIKSIEVPTFENVESSLQKSEVLVPKIIRELGRNGYHSLMDWMKDRRTFSEDLTAAFKSLSNFQNGTGGWAAFEEQVRGLVQGMTNDEMKKAFFIEMPLAIKDVVGVSTRGFMRFMLLAGMTLFDVEVLVSTYRATQRELVWYQWERIFRFTRDELGQRFYQIITSTAEGFRLFQHVDLMVQTNHFTHALNWIFLRINEEEQDVLMPMIVELGKRHRSNHSISSAEVRAFFDPLIQAVGEMLGVTEWRGFTRDAWAHAIAVIERYFTIGWLSGDSQKDFLSLDVLRKLRDDKPHEYDRFFELFAKEIGKNDSKKIATRYRDYVSMALDSNDPVQVMDYIDGFARRHKMYHAVTKEDMEKAGSHWLSIASIVFQNRLNGDTKLQWVRLWDFFATPFGCSSLELSYLASLRQKTAANGVPKPTILTLIDKQPYPSNTMLLRYKANKPFQMEAGQFVKLRFQLNDGTPSRFYSVASCPDPKTNLASEFEFCIKKVDGGKVSRYLTCDNPPQSCELLTAAGSFKLPTIVSGMKRFMVSAGVGVIAFMSAARSVSLMAKTNMLNRKAHLTLIHSVRSLNLPYIEELVTIATGGGGEGDGNASSLLNFQLCICVTGKLDVDIATRLLSSSNNNKSPKNVEIRQGHVDKELLQNYLNKFDIDDDSSSSPPPSPPERSSVPVYACGPRNFQKMVRETFLKDFSHPRNLIHLEFFDL